MGGASGRRQPQARPRDSEARPCRAGRTRGCRSHRVLGRAGPPGPPGPPQTRQEEPASCPLPRQGRVSETAEQVWEEPCRLSLTILPPFSP